MLPNLPPDWAKLSPADLAYVDNVRHQIGTMLTGLREGERPGQAGFAMRGIFLAVADQFDHNPNPNSAAGEMQRGLESTIRAVQNAFGQSWMERFGSEGK
jgi:hypothetical protein